MDRSRVGREEGEDVKARPTAAERGVDGGRTQYTHVYGVSEQTHTAQYVRQERSEAGARQQVCHVFEQEDGRAAQTYVLESVDVTL